MNQTPSLGFEMEDAGFWSRLRGTPLRDLSRGQLSGALDHRAILAESELPVAVKKTVNDVVLLARLWRDERREVARELCDHFADGLESGESEEQLIKQFGRPYTAAKLIRRAKIRCRPLAWHIWHRGWQLTLCLCLLSPFIWTALVIEYVSAKPTITFDPIKQHDDRSRAISDRERAWPLYRDGLVTIDGLGSLQRDAKVGELIAALYEGPTHSDWRQARDFLSNHKEAVSLFAEAAKQRELGFINRDPENDQWMRWSSGGGWETYNKPGTVGPRTLLAQTQDTRTVAALLRGELHAAIEDGDGPRAVEMILALLQLADHQRQSYDCIVVDQVSFSRFRETLRQFSELILNHPELLTDADLRQLSERISTCLGGGRIAYRVDAELKMWEDYLQWLYTDDGDGNGRITAKGMRSMADWADQSVRDVFEHVRTTDNPAWSADLSAKFAGSAIAARIADRKTMLEKVKQLIELRKEMIDDVDTLSSESRYVKERERIGKDEMIRFLPILVMAGAVPRPWEIENNPARGQVALNMERDAALLMIALEQHRRRTGDWPQQLSELVPGELPSVPLDLFSKPQQQPLIYELIDEKPRVYSVGANHRDDGGTRSDEGSPGWQADSGDWQLIPPE